MDLRSQVQAQTKELAELNRILAQYPDAKAYTDRWGTKYYVTASLSPDHPDLQFEQRRSCGCCRDAAYQVSAYLEVGSARIHPAGWYRRTYSYANTWTGDPEFSEAEIRNNLSGLPEERVASMLSYLSYLSDDEDDEEDEL